jgi:energy-coupling factor transport system ATP-binding protein
VLVAGTTGSGKTTLLRALAGLLEPTTGAVSVDGVAVGSREARGQVAIVFQNPESQFFAETVLADVAFGPRNLRIDDPEEAAAAALEAVGLDPARFGTRSPFTLSGGEARRVAVAGALAMRAPYLLLDEPTAGLDSTGRADVLAAIDAERGRAGLVVVTHDPEEFLSRADRLLVLRDGAVAYDSAPAGLLDGADRYEAAGLRLPEDVRAQALARSRGAAVASPVFEPVAAAHALLAAREAVQ